MKPFSDIGILMALPGDKDGDADKAKEFHYEAPVKPADLFREIFRALKPGGRISITDIVSAKQLSQSIVNDPKLWAS